MILGGWFIVSFYIACLMIVSEPDGRLDFVSILISCMIYNIVCIGLITGPRHVFVPHPRHEDVVISCVLSRLSVPSPFLVFGF